MKFNIFGRFIIRIERRDSGWHARYLSHDGKSRPVTDIQIPAHLSEQQLIEYLDDVYHELATPERPQITMVP